jgi:hypothetical protein
MDAVLLPQSADFQHLQKQSAFRILEFHSLHYIEIFFEIVMLSLFDYSHTVGSVSSNTKFKFLILHISYEVFMSHKTICNLIHLHFSPIPRTRRQRILNWIAANVSWIQCALYFFHECDLELLILLFLFALHFFEFFKNLRFVFPAMSAENYHRKQEGNSSFNLEALKSRILSGLHRFLHC